MRSYTNKTNAIEITKSNVNIYKYPELVMALPIQSDEITIGDLHANAMKLLHFLVAEKVIDIDAKSYQKLSELYQDYATLALLLEDFNNFRLMHDKKRMQAKYSEIMESFPKEAIAQDMELYCSLISKITILSRPRIRLIGDELSDRGSSDFFILAILKRLDEEKIPVTILLSNHGMSFIECYELRLPYISQTLFGPYCRSMYNLDYMIAINTLPNLVKVKKEHSRLMIDEIVRDIYLPKLKLIDVNIIDNEVVIYSHAPIDVATIASYAKLLGVEFKDETAQALKNTIDLINQSFQQNYVSQNKVHQMYKPENTKYDKHTDPVGFGMWNRNYDVLDRSPTYKGYSLVFVHGHDTPDIIIEAENIINLDDQVGKKHDGQFNDELLEQILLKTKPTQVLLTNGANSLGFFNNKADDCNESSSYQVVINDDKVEIDSVNVDQKSTF